MADYLASKKADPIGAKSLVRLTLVAYLYPRVRTYNVLYVSFKNTWRRRTTS